MGIIERVKTLVMPGPKQIDLKAEAAKKEAAMAAEFEILAVLDKWEDAIKDAKRRHRARLGGAYDLNINIRPHKKIKAILKKHEINIRRISTETRAKIQLLEKRALRDLAAHN